MEVDLPDNRTLIMYYDEQVRQFKICSMTPDHRLDHVVNVNVPERHVAREPGAPQQGPGAPLLLERQTTAHRFATWIAADLARETELDREVIHRVAWELTERAVLNHPDLINHDRTIAPPAANG